jgi:hypothetical protein
MRDGEDWYVTSDDRYAMQDVAVAVTEVIATHLERTGLFARVRVPRFELPNDGALHLSGSLVRFEAIQDRQAGKELMRDQFGGLVPLLIAVSTDARYEAHVVMSDLRLVDPATGEVLWQGDIQGNSSGETALITKNELEMYEKLNLALKQAVSELVQRIAAIPASRATGRVDPVSGR